MQEQLVIESHGKRDLNQMRSLRLPSEDPRIERPLYMKGEQAWGQVHGAKYKYKYNYFAKLQVQVLISRVKYKYKYFEKLQVQVQVLL